MSDLVVTGASGNIGSVVAEHLIGQGKGVRVVGVDTGALETRFGGRADVGMLDFEDTQTFSKAVAGAKSLFLVRPPPISRVGPTINAFIDAAVTAGVVHVVFSSVAGAESNSIVPHHRIEQHLFGSGVDWTILRPGFFIQNLATAYRRDTVEDDRIYVPAGSGSVAFVDTGDIGEIAALAMVDPAHRGQAYHLTGEEAIDFHHVASILGQELGREIRYEPARVVPYLFHLIGEGLAVPQALVQTILHVGLRRGDGAPVTDQVRTLLGRPPRTVEEYVASNRETFLGS